MGKNNHPITCHQANDQLTWKNRSVLSKKTARYPVSDVLKTVCLVSDLFQYLMFFDSFSFNNNFIKWTINGDL